MSRSSPPAFNRLLTISNLFSISRIVLVIPFAIVMFSEIENRFTWGLVILAAGAVTDKVDGVLARRRGEETEWGRILDPIADKIGAAAVAGVLAIQGLVPLWFLAVIIGRDLLILAGGLLLKWRTGEVLPSNQAGKWAFGVIGVAFLAALLKTPEQLQNAALWTAAGMLTISFALYMKRFADVWRQRGSS